MKRKYIKVVILLITIFLIVFINLKKSSVSVFGTQGKNYDAPLNNSYNDTINALKEVAYSYYMRGTQIQYNSLKRSNSTFAPEEATSQNKNYMVCSGFTESVYKELLGVLIPRTTERLINYASAPENQGRPEIIGYGKKGGSGGTIVMKLYDSGNLKNTINNPSLSQIIPYLHSGDVITYTGHVMLVYDIIYENGKAVDAIMLHSQAADINFYTESKISDQFIVNNQLLFGSPLHFLHYIKRNNTSFPDGVTEGSINMIKLSEEPIWKGIKNNVSGIEECSILRFILSDKQGYAYLNYLGENYYDSNHNKEKISLPKKSVDRLNYSKLFIEKKIDVFSGSIVEPNDNLTYTINIKNKSNKKYSENLIVKESVSPYATYKKSTVYKNGSKINLNCTVSQESGVSVLAWNLGKLNSQDDIIIEYTVQVNENTYGKTISSTGTVSNIPNANIKNKVGNNLTSSERELIKKSFNEYKGNKTGKELINEIYLNIGKSLNLNTLDIKSLVKDTDKTSSNFNTISLNKDNPFYGMVLNNYWSSLRKEQYTVSKNKVYYYDLKNWRDYDDSNRRADTIFTENFQTGDILIYINEDDYKYTYNNNTIKKTPVTYENGEYAYIYINGQGFVGINYGNDRKKGTNDDRNIFDAKYYKDKKLTLYTSSTNNESYLNYMNRQTLFGKDYYVILRPSLSFDITAPELKVSYSTKSPTNKNVIATITANEEIKSISGWTLSDNKKKLTKEYSQNVNENIIVKDVSGNEAKINVKITNIDKVKPTLSVSYSTKSPTNKNVVATITANEEVQSISGWTLSDNKKKLKKEYSKNVSEAITVKDAVGNKSIINIKITNIDKVAPNVNVSYSTQSYTTENVTATITANEEVQSINGWTLSEDKKKLTKKFSENVDESIKVKDLAGNEKIVQIKIDNIFEAIQGDLNDNGKLDSGDIIKIYRHIAQSNNVEIAAKHPEWKLSDQKIIQGDLNKNGQVDMGDVIKIQRYIAAKNSPEVAQKHPEWLNIQ